MSSWSEELSFKKGDVLFKIHDNVDGLFFVKSGSVCCFNMNQGHIIALSVSNSSDVVGSDTLSKDQSSFTYNAICTTDCEIVKIDKNYIQQFLDDAPMWMNDMLEILSARLLETKELVTEHKIDSSKILGREFTPEENALIHDIFKVE